MVLTLVLITFALLVAHDFYLQRRQARRLGAKEAVTVVQTDATAFPMNVVVGSRLRLTLRIIPGTLGR